MKIRTNHFILSAYDGKTVLRLTIDRPDKYSTNISTYLYGYSLKIEEFARKNLYYSLIEQYERYKNRGNRFSAYLYRFKIVCTCEQETNSSYLLIVDLYQGDTHLVTNLDSVICFEDLFIPHKLITRRLRQHSVLILNKDGAPCLAEFSNGKIQYTPAEKCRSMII